MVGTIDRYMAKNMGISPSSWCACTVPWLADFDRQGAPRTSQRRASSWEWFARLPESPGFKRKLDDKGVLAYLATRGSAGVAGSPREGLSPATVRLRTYKQSEGRQREATCRGLLRRPWHASSLHGRARCWLESAAR